MDSIVKSPGLLVKVNLKTVLSLKSITWNQRFAKEGVTKISPTRTVRTEYFELVGAGVMDFKSSRPIVIDVGEQITLSFPDLKKVLVTVDGTRPEFGEDGAPVIGSLDIRGEEFQLVAERAQVTYLARQLDVEILPKPEFLQ